MHRNLVARWLVGWVVGWMDKVFDGASHVRPTELAFGRHPYRRATLRAPAREGTMNVATTSGGSLPLVRVLGGRGGLFKGLIEIWI